MMSTDTMIFKSLILALRSPLFVDSENVIAWCQGGTTKFTKRIKMRETQMHSWGSCSKNTLSEFSVHSDSDSESHSLFCVLVMYNV